ncbi:exodeoxyribonuclease VII small subunit [Polynucleobacter sp. MWH-Spelu-300-X4]|uniref:exodeoxyribonuclease VII small subunit n=1 Tax=Polynucleobacter sp. MWH-Spelu-300-X4 TaxID=2689109 RepID=UPI001BFDA850|nr:exodeoxyribonuclease VII small subunit [Polynucleobacter sp. MWH-Spelu-300-X4]QWD79466.1 exodeoxyribonuclease VII small subunit [Polynucleobacter sp. MWH-Spelu-300-X4]
MPKKSDSVENSVDPKLRYEDAVGQLEVLISQMESGKLSLEETLEAYKRGAELLKHCQQVLLQVEHQVKVFQG